MLYAPMGERHLVARPYTLKSKSSKIPQANSNASTEQKHPSLTLKDDGDKDKELKDKKRSSLGLGKSFLSRRLPDENILVKPNGKLNIPSPPPRTPDGSILERTQSTVTSIDTIETDPFTGTPTLPGRQFLSKITGSDGGEKRYGGDGIMVTREIHQEHTGFSDESNTVACQRVNQHMPRSSLNISMTSSLPLMRQVQLPSSEPALSSSSPERTLVELERSSVISGASTGTINSTFIATIIDKLIGENPRIRSELTLLKRTILEHEIQVQMNRKNAEAAMHEKLWETMTTVGKLEEDLKVKEDATYNLQRKLYDYDMVVKKLQDALSSMADENSRLNTETDSTSRNNKIISDEHLRKIMRLELEKRLLEEQIEVLQASIVTERKKLRHETERKEKVLRQNDVLKIHFKFYREYFDRQEALYNGYFTKVRAGDAESPGLPSLETMASICQQAESEGGEGTISKSAYI